MPRGKHVKLIIGVDGECSVDAVNFIGPACQIATGEILAALGGQVINQRDKPEARFRERTSEGERERTR